MAALLPSLQHYEDQRDGTTIGIHKVKLVSASDTLVVAQLANTTASASSAQIRGANEAAATVTDDGDDTLTIVGTAGNTVTICTNHGPGTVNSGSEA